jgi:hypothetical protein
MRRAIVPVLPDAIKSAALNQGSTPASDEVFIALLDELFELRSSATHLGKSAVDGDNRYNLAYERLSPIVRYMQETTALMANEAGGTSGW